VSWISGPETQRGVLVVTGSPGVGKSAVLGRIVTSADTAIAGELPPDDVATRAPLGAVSCAVHAKGKTALEVAKEIARAASAPIPEQVSDLAPALRVLLEERKRDFTVILDALDESASPDESRIIVSRVLLPLAETCGPLGARVVAGTRRRDDQGDLLGAFGAAAQLVDLDAPQFFALADLVDYVQATLQLRGDERPDNPYAQDAVAGPVAARIAAQSDGNFLVAGLVARAHGMHDAYAIAPGQIAFTPTVDAALFEYLALLPPVSGVTARQALTALAFAEPPGMGLRPWRKAVQALYGEAPTETQLRVFARSSAANFLVEISTADEVGGVFRLFHQALNDVLLAARADSVQLHADERALARGLLADGQAGGWPDAPRYTLHALARHAERGGVVDEVLADHEYLLYADLRRMIPAAGTATTVHGRERARLLRRTPQAIDASPSSRASLFTVTEACDHLGNAYRSTNIQTAYRAAWAVITPRTEEIVLDAQAGGSIAVCEIEAERRTLLATTSGATVNLWDPDTGEQLRTLNGHAGSVFSVCALKVDGRTLVATSGTDRVVRLWNPATAEQVQILSGHDSSVVALCPIDAGASGLLATVTKSAVWIWDLSSMRHVRSLPSQATRSSDRIFAACTVKVRGQDLLAVGDGDGVVRLWDPVTGEAVRAMTGYASGVRALCEVETDGRALLALGGFNNVGLWLCDLDSGERRALQPRTTRGTYAMCSIKAGGRILLATGDNAGEVRLWDTDSGALVRTFQSDASGVRALRSIETVGRTLLAAATSSTVWLWDPAAEGQVRAADRQGNKVDALCAVTVRGRAVLATSGHSSELSLWDSATGEALDSIGTGAAGAVTAVCPVVIGGHASLAIGYDRGAVRLRSLDNRVRARAFDSHTGSIFAICVLEADGRRFLATGGYGSVVRLWDLATGELERSLSGHPGGVRTMSAVEADGRTVLATGGYGGVVRLWDPLTGQLIRAFDRHGERVFAMCTVKVEGRNLLATGGTDRGIRLWNPSDGTCAHTLTGHTGHISALCAVETGGRHLLAIGSADHTVRLWDPDALCTWVDIPVPNPVRAIAAIDGFLALGLDNGVLTLRIPPSNNGRHANSMRRY
jgi:WD40 repeat protein